VPIAVNHNLQDRPFVVAAREAKAVTRIVGSLLLTWLASVQRKESVTSTPYLEVQIGHF
jgi:hypothetical protein